MYTQQTLPKEGQVACVSLGTAIVTTVLTAWILRLPDQKTAKTWTVYNLLKVIVIILLISMWASIMSTVASRPRYAN